MSARSFCATKTCDECPWRKDVPTHRFSPERFAMLRASTKQGFGQPIFACHKSPEGGEFACVGFLMVEGDKDNFAVRLALWRRAFDPSKLEATGPLFESFEAMARANGVED